MKANLVTRTYISCPNCGVTEHRVDHLFDGRARSFGPWYCDDCGRSFMGTVGAGNEVNIEFAEGQKILTYDLLMLPCQLQPIYFVVQGLRIRNPGDDPSEEEGNSRYYYEEHSCPTNFIGGELISIDGDTDPHGLFEFVRGVEQIKEMGDDPDFTEIFPEIVGREVN